MNVPCTFARGEIQDGAMSIATVGLSQHDQPELHMRAVPEMLAPVAERFLGQLAMYATQKGVKAGETIGVPTHFGANFTRLVGGEGDTALTAVDVMEDCDESGPPLLVLATELFEEAFRRYQQGEMQVAAQLLQTSLELYPGRPGVQDLGPNVNTENFRAYLLYFSLTQDEQHLSAALERSVSYQIEQLGAPLAILSKLLGDPERVRSQAELILKVRLATWDHMLEETPEAIESPVAPLPQPHLHTNVEGGLDTALSLVPVSFADYFYRGAGRDAVEGEDALALLVDAIAAHREAIGGLVTCTQGATMMWGATEMERQAMPAPMDKATGLEAIIMGVLAQVGLLAGAGLDADARRRWFGLGGAASEDEQGKVSAFVAEREQELVEIVRQAQGAEPQ